MKRPELVFQKADQSNTDYVQNTRLEESFDDNQNVEENASTSQEVMADVSQTESVVENNNSESDVQVIEVTEDDIPEYCDLTRYLKKHPKKIIGHEYLEQKTVEVFHNLGRKLSDSIVITGFDGCGKTTIVENLTQQIIKNKCPSMFKNTTVIQVGADIFSPNTLVEGIVYSLTLILTHVKACEVNKVILVFDNFDEFPPVFWSNFNYVKNTLKQTFDFEFFKIIMVMPYKFFTDESLYTLSFVSNSNLIKLVALLDFELSAKIIEPKVKKITKLHGNIKFPKELIERLLLGVYSKNNVGSINLTMFADYVDMACSICKQREGEKVDLNDLKQVFSVDHIANEKISKENRLSTSYHEAGHILFALACLPDEMQLMGAKVVYDTDKSNAGCTFVAIRLLNIKRTKAENKKLVAFYLAGRCAEKIIGMKESMGAVSDLNEARNITKEFIYSSGTSKVLGKNCLYAYGEETYTLSDATFVKAEEECKAFIKKATKYCKKILAEHEEFLHILAKALYENDYLSRKEILKLWDSYKKKSKEKSKKESMKKTAKWLLE